MKITFDIGGTHTRIGSSIDGKAVVNYKIFDTPQDFEEAMSLMAKEIDSIANGLDIDSLIGCAPGVIDDDIVVSSPHLDRWIGKNIRSSLSDNLRGISVADIRIVHDASLACLGESIFGAGKGYENVAYITVSTGLGGGFVKGGKIFSGRYNPEVGHQIIDLVSGATAESISSGTAIKAKFGMEMQELNPDDKLHAVEITSEALAAAMNNSILHWSPDVFVLGGSVILDTEGLIEKTVEKLEKLQKAYPRLPKIVKAELGDRSALYGGLV